MHLPHILHGAKAPLTRLVTLRKACTRSCRGSKGSIERGQSRAYNLRTYTCRQNGSHGGSQRYPIVSSHSCEQFVYITTMAAISREIGPSCFVARCPRCPLAQARPIPHARASLRVLRPYVHMWFARTEAGIQRISLP